VQGAIQDDSGNVMQMHQSQRRLGLGTFANAPNPVGLLHPGVGHSRKPGDPLRTWTMRLQSRQK